MQPALDHHEVMHEAVMRLVAKEATGNANAEQAAENMLFRVGLEFHGAAAMVTDWEAQAEDYAQHFDVSAERVRWIARKVNAGCVAVGLDDASPVESLDVARAWYIHTIGYDPVEDEPGTTLSDIQETRTGYIECIRAEGAQ